MDSSEFQRLMGMAVCERARAIAVAEKHFEERVQALRHVRELALLAASQLQEPAPLRRGDVIARVKIAVAGMPEVFGLRDVVKSIESQQMGSGKISTKAISSAVKRLVGERLEVVERGKGKRGSRYRRLATQSPEMAQTG